MKTIGEQRVRIDFNVSGSGAIDQFKSKTADLINDLEDMKVKQSIQNEHNAEYHRLISLAQTAYEEACMWAVKAITI